MTGIKEYAAISVYLSIISILISPECFAQDPEIYKNEAAQGQCSYTFQVPTEQVTAQCLTPELRQLLEEIRKENQQISSENAGLKTEIQTIIKEYGDMVDTVKRLEKETAAWREIVEWPVYDVPFAPSNVSEILDMADTHDDCYQAVKRNRGKEGIYRVRPQGASHPYHLYCDAQGWTVILRRFDGKVDFYRNWNDFSGGFGELGGEHFIGLELLHILTSNKLYEFRVAMLGWNNKMYTSNYDDFSVADEMDDYQLSIGNMTDGNVESYFTAFDGSKFTTYDRDNDEWSQNNCAQYYRGGWWLRNCGADPCRRWCNGQGCLSWGEQNGKKIILSIRPMAVKGSEIASRSPPRPVQPTAGQPKVKKLRPKKPKKKTRSKKTSKPKSINDPKGEN